MYSRKFGYKKKSKGQTVKTTQSKELLTRRDVVNIAKKTMAKEEELKYADDRVQISPGATNTTAIGTNLKMLCPIGMGTQPYERVGNDIVPFGISFKVDVARYDSSNNVRIIIFQRLGHSDQITHYPKLTEILEWPTGAPAIFHGGLEQYNRKFKEANIILYDKSFHFEAVYTPDNQRKSKFIDLRFKKGVIKRIEYTDVNGTAGNNLLWLMAVSDSEVAPHPTISYSSRVYYRDP